MAVSGCAPVPPQKQLPPLPPPPPPPRRSHAIPESNLWIGTTQGDCNYAVDRSMPLLDFEQLDAAAKRADVNRAAIVLCHSLPPFWARPKNKWGTCAPCPPVGYRAPYAIGRSMAETDM